MRRNGTTWCWSACGSRRAWRRDGGFAIHGLVLYCPLLMLSLLRKLVGWTRISGDRRERWIEPSNAITQAVLAPGAEIVPPEQTLHERVRARHPIPERRRAAPATREAPPPQPPPAAVPASTERAA